MVSSSYPSVAQLVEQQTFNLWVPDSSSGGGTIHPASGLARQAYWIVFVENVNDRVCIERLLELVATR